MSTSPDDVGKRLPTEPNTINPAQKRVSAEEYADELKVRDTESEEAKKLEGEVSEEVKNKKFQESEEALASQKNNPDYKKKQAALYLAKVITEAQKRSRAGCRGRCLKKIRSGLR